MLEAHILLKASQTVTDESKQPLKAVRFHVVLTYAERQKSRHKCETACGKTLGWFIDRGIVLASDDLLVCTNGELVRVIAAPESVCDVFVEDKLLFARLAYHLGNRHVPLQLVGHTLRFQQDHVLEQMVEGLGGQAQHVCQPFHPESGAYHSHRHHDHRTSEVN